MPMQPSPLPKEPPEPMVKWVLASHRPAVGWPRRKTSQSPGVSCFELQSGNSHLEHAVLVLHGIGRREGVLGQAEPMGQPGCLSLARLQLARVPDHTVPSSCHLSTLQRPPLLFCPHHPHPSLPASFEDASFLLPADFSLLSQRWHILFLFNDTDFSEGAHLFFQLDVSSPGVPCP